MAIIKIKKKTITKDVEKLELSYIASGMDIGSANVENIWQFLKKN